MTGMIIEEGGNIYNSSVLINPRGILESVYRKRNTMPFVETSKFTKGTLSNTFLADGYTIAPIICFDSVFIRNYFRDRKPDLCIVTSNDTFAETTILSRLHQAYGVINARSMGLPLLQVMQNGPSFYVDSRGRLKNLAGPYEQAIGIPVEIK
jgi:apolipoprotein N-acyltransferase